MIARFCCKVGIDIFKQQGNENLIRLLFDNGASLAVLNSKSRTVFHDAIRNEDFPLLHIILSLPDAKKVLDIPQFCTWSPSFFSLDDVYLPGSTPVQLRCLLWK